MGIATGVTLASGGGDKQEDGSKKPSGLAPDICGGSAEGGEEQHKETPGPSQATPGGPDATAGTVAASSGLRRSERKRSRGKTAATLKRVLKLAKSVPGQQEEGQGSSEETETSSDAQTSPYDAPDPEGESPAKKRKSEEAVAGEVQVEAGETSELGESSLSSEPLQSEDLEFPDSLLELYLSDTLQEGIQDSSFATWLLDPDGELPQSPAPSGETDDWPMGAEAVPGEPYPSYNLNLLAEVAGFADEQEQTTVGHTPSTSMSSEFQDKSKGEPPAAVAESAETVQPSTSAGQHPFYRMPSSWPEDVNLPPMTAARYLKSRPEGRLATALERVRCILTKRRLDGKDVVHLQEGAKNLLAFAGRYFSHPTERQFNARLVKNMTLRVLVAHYLLAVCQVIGPPMQKEAWWFYSMNRMLAPPANWRPPPLDHAGQRVTHWGPLLHKLHEAMGVLRRGERLSPETIVYIMWQTFCVPLTPRFFQGSEWDGWRQAEKDFRQGNFEGSMSDDEDGGD
ncbi:hypothetical protein Emed_004282 [Eimeria media]